MTGESDYRLSMSMSGGHCPVYIEQNYCNIGSSICCFDGGAMECLFVVFALVAYTTVVADHYLPGINDAMAVRVDAQAWRVDRLTERFQAITHKVDAARAAAKTGGDMARHLIHNHMSGKNTY